jgi:hypothetical protein
MNHVVALWVPLALFMVCLTETALSCLHLFLLLFATGGFMIIVEVLVFA